MLIAHTLDQELTQTPVVLTIGVFDGMHLGHQQLISTAVERAHVLGLQSAGITFDPHPDSVVHPDRAFQLLSTLKERISLIEQLGPDMLVVAPFDRTTMNTSAENYMRQIIHALPLSELWVGDDFALGRKREGTISRLQELGEQFGYSLGAVARVLVDDQPVSSTRVRDALGQGDVRAVVPLLGRYYSIEGEVIHGDKRGRSIGFPTANLSVSPDKLLPANGVYASRVHYQDQTYNAVTNLGNRPTFNGVRLTIEAHLLDFSGDLYGQNIQVAFVERLRGEQRFAGVDELVAQIGRDATKARSLLEENSASLI